MKTILLLTFATTLAATAQVQVTGQESDDRQSGNAVLIIGTRDREIMPLEIEKKTTAPDAATTRTETVTRLRQADGDYADWRTVAVTTRQVSDRVTTRTTEITEADRQGRVTVRESTTEEITRWSDGREQTTGTTHRRNASGQLVPDAQVTATVTPNVDGSRTVVQVEKRADINGRWQRTRQVEEQIVKVSDAESKIERQILAADHLHGGFRVTSRETETVRVSGDMATRETRIQKAQGTGWRDEGRIIVTETKTGAGRRERETVEVGRSLYARLTGTEADLVPQRKIVEREARQPDGRVVIERQEYRRDVNGGWAPVIFSTEAGQAQK
jgi:hypothetical protein